MNEINQGLAIMSVITVGACLLGMYCAHKAESAYEELGKCKAMLEYERAKRSESLAIAWQAVCRNRQLESHLNGVSSKKIEDFTDCIDKVWNEACESQKVK